MQEVLRVDVGSLFNENDNVNFISQSGLESFCKENKSSFDAVRRSLEDKTSPITHSFSVELSLPNIRTTAKYLRKRYKNMLILGIGGSTLGFRTILQALKGPYYNYEALLNEQPRVFVLDNVDPLLTNSLEKILDFKNTALVYISKSGATPEPAANFIHFYKKYIEGGGVAEDIVIICDPANNGINNIAKKLKCFLHHIPPDLPGRYSVLSAVGFLPAEFIRLNSKDFLNGAARVHHAILHTPPHQNAVFILGSCISKLARKGKKIHTMFSYSNVLSEFGLWFAQLWGESLGKKETLTGEIVHAGTTPLPALGATDQHSLLQLFKEGPNDKVFGFVTIENFTSDVNLTNEFPSEEEYSYFEGHRLSEQLRIEQISTEISLVHSKRPCYRIILPDISASTLGGLFYFMEALVIFIAKLWNINPFNQPGVEEGKNMTYALMGREDFTSSRSKHERELEKFSAQSRLLKL
jgi:glucose-6-phosphate isomerase